MFIPLLLTAGFFLGGLILGAVILHTLSPLVSQELQRYLVSYIKAASSYTEGSIPGLKNWLQISKMQAVSLGLLWVCGLTVVGSPFISLIIGARGFVVGFTVGFLVQEEAGKGLLLAIAGVLPQNLCYIPAFLGAGALAFYFSLNLTRLQGASLRRIGVYSLFFLLFLLPVLLGSWLETYLAPGLLRLAISLF